MIGGCDIVVPTPLPAGIVVDICLRAILRTWRRAVIVDGVDGARYASYAQVPLDRVTELLLYRDEEAFQSWKELGADSTNADALVYLITGEQQVTLVVNDPEESAMRALLSGIRGSLDDKADLTGRRARAAA